MIGKESIPMPNDVKRFFFIGPSSDSCQYIISQEKVGTKLTGKKILTSFLKYFQQIGIKPFNSLMFKRYFPGNIKPLQKGIENLAT